MATSQQPDLTLEWRLTHLKSTDAERAWIRRMRALPKRPPRPAAEVTQEPLFRELPVMTSRRQWRRHLQQEYRAGRR
jgi:hypothetical protein